MAKKKVIIEVQYDVDTAVKNVNTLTDEIVKLEDEQKRMKEAFKQGTLTQEQYNQALAENREQLKKGKAERANYIKQIQAEKGSVDDLTAQIKALEKERNKLNQETKEGRETAEAYNKKIIEMKEALKEAKTGTKETGNAFSRFLGDLEAAPGPIGGIVGGLKGMVSAAWKFVKTPLGAILAALVLAFNALKRAFQSNEDRMNKLRVITGKLSGVFKAFRKAIEPVVDFIVDTAVAAFDKLTTAVSKVVTWVGKALDRLGFEKAAQKVQDYQEKVAATVKASGELAEMEAKLTKELRFQEKVMLDYQKLAEKQRQIRDDESKSIDERIAANKRLGQILKEQMSEELRIANLALAVAEKRIELDGESTENLDARAEALTRISDIQERITGQESEQLVNINALLKERADLEKQAADEKKMRLEEELKAEQEHFEEMYKRREEAAELLRQLDEENYLKKLETDEERRLYEIELENQDFERKIANEELLDTEIELLRAEHTARLEAIDESYKQERIRKEKEALQSTLTAMDKIGEAAGVLKDERIRNQSELLQSAIQFNQLEIQSEKEKLDTFTNFASQLTNFINQGHEQQYQSLMAQKAMELELVGDNTAAREEIDKKYARLAAQLKERQFEEDKTKAIVDTAINTAVAVVKALPNAVLAAAVGAAGLIQIGIIKSKKFQAQTYERGGKMTLFGGRSHSQGGTKLFGSDGSFLEVEKNESAYVLNKNATAEIAMLSRINESFGGKAMTNKSAYLQDGGQAQGVPGLTADDLRDAMKNITIVTQVRDIKTGWQEVDDVIENSVI